MTDAATPAEAPVQKKDARAWARGEVVHLEGSDTTAYIEAAKALAPLWEFLDWITDPMAPPRYDLADSAWATKYGMKQTKEPSADAQASLGKQPHNSLPGGNELAPKMGVTEGAQTMTKDIEEQQVVEADQRRKQGQKETELIRNAMNEPVKLAGQAVDRLSAAFQLRHENRGPGGVTGN